MDAQAILLLTSSKTTLFVVLCGTKHCHDAKQCCFVNVVKCAFSNNGGKQSLVYNCALTVC